MGYLLDGGSMKTIDAIRILERAGYTVKFTEGSWVVTIAVGMTESLNRAELVELARDLEHVAVTDVLV